MQLKKCVFKELRRMPLEQDQNLVSQKLFESLGYRLEKHLEIFQEMHYMSGSKDGKWLMISVILSVKK